MRPADASSGPSGGGSESGVERLINAAKKNDVKRIVEEIKSGVDVNSRWGEYLVTALHVAAEYDHCGSVKVLLEVAVGVIARRGGGVGATRCDEGLDASGMDETTLGKTGGRSLSGA